MSRSNILGKEYLFLTLVVAFSLFVRIVPFQLITIITVLVFLSLVAYHFYTYTSEIISNSLKSQILVTYSWGTINLPNGYLEVKKVLIYLKNKDLNFYKTYILQYSKYIIFGLFILCDLLVVFKNLNLKNAGVYIAMSVFTKFVFLVAFYLEKVYEKTFSNTSITEEELIETFNKQLGSYLSGFSILFIVFFLLSKYITEIFFGYSFSQFQTSLPFILLANISLTIMLCIYLTAQKLNKLVVEKILKVFSVFFLILFVFMDINSIDTTTYFIIGMSTLLSILLYNFVIKKPEYIRGTYNLLF